MENEKKTSRKREDPARHAISKVWRRKRSEWKDIRDEKCWVRLRESENEGVFDEVRGLRFGSSARKKKAKHVYIRDFRANYKITLQYLFIYFSILNTYLKTSYKTFLYVNLYIFSPYFYLCHIVFFIKVLI